ncbi:MAG TPA: peptidyl-prolyl cis-trans isomerase [Polyangiaceae bacterium]|jgi:DNA-directed RNA polymerase subunit F
MRGLRRIDAFALAFGLAVAGLACSSCKRASSGSSADAGVASSGALTPQQAAQVLARVGDRTITLGDFEAALEHLDQFDRMRYQSPERRKELLGEMIDVMLLADEARAKGYDKDPVTQQELREILRDAMLKTAREGVPAPNEIPAEDVRAYYDAHRADFHDPERRRVSAIVLSSEATAATTLDTARKANGAQWGELVRAKSTDALAKSNTPIEMAGDFGFVSPPGDARGANQRVPEEVRAAIFDVDKVGDVLPRVVKAGNGKYYVVKLTGRTEAHDRTLEDSERQIRVKLAQDDIRAREVALLDDLRRQYPVKIDEAALGQVSVQLPSVDAGADAR